MIAALIALLISGKGSSSSSKTASTPATTAARTSTTGSKTAATSTHAASTRVVALSLTPTGTVYVCLIGDGGRKLIPGRNLAAGESTPTYHAHRFLITLGNSEVTMYVDGQRRTVAPSSQPIGYSITRAAGRRVLPAAQRPTCGG